MVACARVVCPRYVMYVYIFINTHWVSFLVVAIVDVYSSDRVWLKIKCVSGREDYLTDLAKIVVSAEEKDLSTNFSLYSNNTHRIN